MKKWFLIFVFLFLQISCHHQQLSDGNSEELKLTAQASAIIDNENSKPFNTTPQSDLETSEEYAGTTIDQQFPVLKSYHLTENKPEKEKYSADVENFQIAFSKYAPKTIEKNGKAIFFFKTLYSADYWANHTGISHLLGTNSKEVYVVGLGPGGVCCTNYWITDVSGKTPRNVFRSEDYGGFRNSMEVFDADDDGIYELVQFDSAFRYFLEDCGACSPEPRAVFRYDKKAGVYLPAKNIQQEFVKDSFLETEKWLAETSEELKTTENLSKELEFRRNLLAYIVDLFYLGDDQKAWKDFDKYYSGYRQKEEIRGEIKKRLRQSKFYQALKKAN